MYKMVAIDLDDTLLNEEGIITDITKMALAAAVEKGVFITLATGRMYSSAKQIAQQLNLNVPLITYQGALIKNLLDDQILYERFLPKDIVLFFIDYAEKYQLHLQAYNNDMLYAIKENTKVKDYAAMSNVSYEIISDFRELPVENITKLLFYEEPSVLDRIYTQLQPKFGDQAHITKSKPYFLEIMHPEGTKGHAVRYLADHIGCDLSEIIAIGDSWNDHEMIETAGLGVAMDNAVDTLKEIADYITLDNNHNGVKHVIDKFILS